MMVVGRRLQ